MHVITGCAVASLRACAASFRSPARTSRPTPADRFARLRQTILLPDLPLCGIRCFPMPRCEPPHRVPCVPAAPMSRHKSRPLSPPNCIRTRLGIPPCALLAEYRGLPVTRQVEHAPRLADLEWRCVVSPAPSQSRRSAGKPRATGRCEASDAVPTERRRRCVRAAPILQYSGAVMRLGRPCVVGATQVAPTPRFQPREVQRNIGARLMAQASKTRPSNRKLELVAYSYGPVWAQKVIANSGIFGW